jgi:hypothetical protein
MESDGFSDRSGMAPWPMRWRRRSARKRPFPGRQVISLSGDGGFAMLMGDFLSLKQLDLPVKMVVFNNGALGFHRARAEVRRASSKPAPSFKNPNFAAMAEAVGMRGIRLEDPADVEVGNRGRPRARGTGPDRCRGQRAPSSPCLPPLPLEMAKGFTLYMLKSRDERPNADEIIDLAKTNSLAIRRSLHNGHHGAPTFAARLDEDHLQLGGLVPLSDASYRLLDRSILHCCEAPHPITNFPDS